MVTNSQRTSAHPEPSTAASGLTIQDQRNRLAIELDGRTGLPVALEVRRERIALSLSAVLVTEGIEVEGHPFGMAYAETVTRDQFRLVSPQVRHELAGDDETFTVSTTISGWDVDWEYHVRDSSPRLEIQLVLSPAAGNDIGTLRNLHLQVAFTPPELDGWQVESPGSAMRPGVDVTSLTTPVSVSEASFRGAGIVLVHNPEQQSAVLIWPFSRTEQARTDIQAVDGAFRVSIETGLAGRLRSDEKLRYRGLQLDLFAGTWDQLRPQIRSWYPAIGISSPVDTPDWVPGASIFEVQIGTSVFWNGFAYSPYPTMRDLYDDIGRIAGLGFDCIQIMPRQPFPSYNVYDYADITLSYGDEDDLRRVVEACHAHGLRVILDILMHGVIDAEVIHRAADRVRSGPYFPRLDEGVGIAPDDEFRAYEEQDSLVSWSRHILDFEEHWAAGSPGAHPLVAEHPEWFMRDSAGDIVGVYTKAFDVANPGWQEYFTDAALHLVETLDIDGFRFDAPTYNEFSNWSPATEKRASVSQLGSVRHFQRLRPRMKAIKPDAVMYTEPSGILFRQSMDITYNYDEHWLIRAVLRPDSALAASPPGIRDARDLARWFRDKDAALPIGSITAHHIDSHDSFWWPLPGFKWRREQYGLPATRALLAVWSLIGGVYMTFVGGEDHLEDEIRRMHRLRRELPEIRVGAADYDALTVADEHIFAVARIWNRSLSLVLVNLSNREVETTCRLDVQAAGMSGDAHLVADTWNDLAVEGADGYTWSRADLGSFPIRFAPFQPRVLTVRPASGLD